MELKVHHVGYAVTDIDKAIKSLEVLGYSAETPVTEDDIRNVKIVFMKNGETVVELVAPNGDGNPVDGIIKKSGSGPYHICYISHDMDADVKSLKKGGFMMIKKPEEAPAIGGAPVTFLYSAASGMIELVEIKE